jgi:hypothetical protein
VIETVRAAARTAKAAAKEKAHAAKVAAKEAAVAAHDSFKQASRRSGMFQSGSDGQGGGAGGGAAAKAVSPKRTSLLPSKGVPRSHKAEFATVVPDPEAVATPSASGGPSSSVKVS